MKSIQKLFFLMPNRTSHPLYFQKTKINSLVYTIAGTHSHKHTYTFYQY